MISCPKDRTTEANEKMRGGEGTARLTGIFEAHIPHVRLLKEITLEPGSSIGAHAHEAEAEIFYVLEGEAAVLDNGAYITLRPGDAHLCSNGETHSLMNKGDSTMKLLAIVVTEAE